MKSILNYIVNLFRYIFKYKMIILSCATQERGVISHLGGTDNGKQFFLPKHKLLVKLRAYERWGYHVRIRTHNGGVVKIISHRHLRTIGDKNPLNNLGELPSCDEECKING